MSSLDVPAPAPGTADAPAAGPAPHTVLVVDDWAMDRHLAGSIIDKLDGWRADFASNGREALEAIGTRAPDVVLTDLLMPEMDGLELVQAIKSKFPGVPVILMTAHGSEDVAIQALQSGAASYVPKKSLARDLAETLDQILSASQINRNQQRILESLTHHETHYQIDNDIALVAPLVGHLEQNIKQMRLCEPSGLILLGVALHEALTNAILHGNLELSSALRESDENLYYQEARLRRDREPYRSRHVFVSATLSRQEGVFVVRDEGNGFDPATLPDPTDPANLGRTSGRGLLLIQTFMDRVEHNDRGNQITLVKRRTAE